MKVKNLLIYYSYLSISTSYAIVPTIDVSQQAQDLQAINSYTAKITTTVAKLGQAIDIANQIRELKSLEQVQQVGGAICKLCSQSDQQKLQLYINQVNDDLCSQFSFAMENIIGLNNNIKKLQDIILLFNTNPKEAGLALQTAALHTQMAVQSTLTHMHALSTQQTQKHLAEEKFEKQNTDAIYMGFKHSGL